MSSNAMCSFIESFFTRELPQNMNLKKNVSQNMNLKKMYLSAAVPAFTISQRTLNSNPVPIVIQECRVIDASLFLVYVLCVSTQWQLD